jgi:hypothetical protein
MTRRLEKAMHREIGKQVARERRRDLLGQANDWRLAHPRRLTKPERGRSWRECIDFPECFDRAPVCTAMCRAAEVREGRAEWLVRLAVRPG